MRDLMMGYRFCNAVISRELVPLKDMANIPGDGYFYRMECECGRVVIYHASEEKSWFNAYTWGCLCGRKNKISVKTATDMVLDALDRMGQ